MFENLIGKNISVNVIVSSNGIDSMGPCLYIGNLLEICDEKFLKMLVTKSGLTYDGGNRSLAIMSKDKISVDKIMYININYIAYISIEE